MVPQDHPHRLLVEGKDDLHSVIHLTERHGIDWDKPHDRTPYIHDSGGFDPLLDALSLDLKLGKRKRIGIVVDADIEPTDRWASIKTALGKVGIKLPKRPDADGTIVPGPGPCRRLGVWLMPDNSNPGMLEDFLGALVPQKDPCWDYAKEAARGAAKRGAPFPGRDFEKARIHTWLAWREEPGQPFGTALTANCFDTNQEISNRFVAWFERLFLSEDPSAEESQSPSP